MTILSVPVAASTGRNRNALVMGSLQVMYLLSTEETAGGAYSLFGPSRHRTSRSIATLVRYLNHIAPFVVVETMREQA